MQVSSKGDAYVKYRTKNNTIDNTHESAALRIAGQDRKGAGERHRRHDVARVKGGKKADRA